PRPPRRRVVGPGPPPLCPGTPDPIQGPTHLRDPRSSTDFARRESDPSPRGGVMTAQSNVSTTSALLPPLPPGEASGIGDCPRAGWGEGRRRKASLGFPSPQPSPEGLVIT